MNTKSISIRPFIGAKDFSLAREFYKLLGFDEHELSPAFCVYHKDALSFYLQDAYVKDWIDNTMVFLEVEDVEAFYAHLQSLNLPAKFPGVRLVPIRHESWGSECFLHDPSGVLWHIGSFNKE